MSETTAEIRRLAHEVIEGGIIAQAAERLVYQIVEVCAEHEKAALASALALLRECLSELRICNSDLRARIAAELEK